MTSEERQDGNDTYGSAAWFAGGSYEGHTGRGFDAAQPDLGAQAPTGDEAYGQRDMSGPYSWTRGAEGPGSSASDSFGADPHGYGSYEGRWYAPPTGSMPHGSTTGRGPAGDAGQASTTPQGFPATGRGEHGLSEDPGPHQPSGHADPYGFAGNPGSAYGWSAASGSYGTSQGATGRYGTGNTPDPMSADHPTSAYAKPAGAGTTATETAERPFSVGGTGGAPSGGGTGSRRAHLRVARMNPWSVMKFGFVVALVCFIVGFVAVAVLYGVLAALGVFAAVSSVLETIAGPGVGDWFSASRILGYTAFFGAINVVVITVLVTVGAYIYNLTADLVGGVEVTLTERE